jgi:hypothetical protein
MRVALKILALPVAVLAAAAIGLIGPWGMPVGAVLLFAACVVGAVLMESQDLAQVEGLTTERDVLPEPLLEAA